MSIFVFALLTLSFLAFHFRNGRHRPDHHRHTRRRPDGRLNACIFILARNEDLADLQRTLAEFELRFNARRRYPYVIVNNVHFTDEFKRAVVAVINNATATTTTVEFGLIPAEEWSVPRWINSAKLRRMQKHALTHVFKGNLMSYHHMCRYYAGFFFRHPLALKYDYYMRLDTHLDFPCPLESDDGDEADPFETLLRRDKVYGFAISLSDEMVTIKTLWYHIKRWMWKKKVRVCVCVCVKIHVFLLVITIIYKKKTKQVSLVNNDVAGLRQIVKRRGAFYPQKCGFDLFHYWNNFEVAAFSLFRDPLYLSYFNFLDRTGGFYYERWGDAPFRTFFILTTVPLNQVHRFKNFAYAHTGRVAWPLNGTIRAACRTNVVDYRFGDCNSIWDNLKYDNGSLINE